ncbi:MAG TPA: hypothetical protein VLA53_03855 [Nitrosopumilaceae archaeon]|nr:hypothetical protein [Nitrosopumilaceae archaeon]
MSSNDTDVENDLAEVINTMETLIDEAVQVYELDKEKVNVIDELYNSLKVVTSFLGFSVDLYPELLNLPPGSKAVLTPSLDVVMIKPNFKSETKRLDQFSLEEVTNILKYGSPALINMARADRTYKNRKISFLKSATAKLKKLSHTNVDDKNMANDLRRVERIKS